jgi:putative acetyltransferase
VHVNLDDPRRDDVRALLQQHLDDMHAESPPESVHALDLDALTAPGITFVTAREDGVLLGCGALKALSTDHGEIKSMRTTDGARGRGVATAVLGWLLDEARRRGLARVSLETGTQEYFRPAVRLYHRHGFVECGPFGDYRLDPFSRFMTITLD